MNGDVPYRDFWAIYPPGQFYALATLFRIFGTNLLVVRIYDTIVRFIIVISLYFIAKKITSPPLALLVCVFSTLLLASARFYAYPVFPSMALILLSVLSLFKGIKTGRLCWLFLAGGLTGIAILFRWDIGLYAFVSSVMAIVIFNFFGLEGEAKSFNRIFFTTIKILLILLGGALLVVLPCYGYWCLRSGFSDFWSQVVISPLTVHLNSRRIPYPSIIPPSISLMQGRTVIKISYPKLLNWLQFYLPLIVFFMAILRYVLLIIKKHFILSTRDFYAITFIILGLLLFTQALSRYDYIHILPSSIIAFLLFISLVHRFVLNLPNFFIKYIFLFITIIIVLIYLIPPVRILLYTINNFSPLGCYSHLDRAGCVYIRENQEQAVDYIRVHTSEGESIFVGNSRHDLIFINDIGFYFLSNRPCATKYHELFPGVATTRPIQEVIVHDIESKKVNWIVLVNEIESLEPNASSVSSGVHILDDFIRSKYKQVAEFGSYGIWNKIIK